MDILQLRSDSVILRRAPGEIQIGTDPRWSIVLDGLSPAQESWIHTLRPGMPVGDVPEAAISICDTLRQATVLVPALDPLARPVLAPASGLSDLPVLSTIRADGRGRSTLEHRARHSVGLSGLGRLGAQLALILAVAGVGQLVLDDRRRVQPTDVGPGGYRSLDIGEYRDSAVSRLVHEYCPQTITMGNSKPGLVVIVEDYLPTPDRFLGLMSADVPHLSVVVREADIHVGPYVVPGITPCITCVTLHLQDQDPRWHDVAHQLRHHQPLTHETVLASTAAALTAAQVLTAIDGGVPTATAARIEIPAPDAIPRVNPLAEHPHCGCC